MVLVVPPARYCDALICFHGCTVGNVVPKKSLGTVGLRRQGDTTDYMPKFQVTKMGLEVAEIRFSNLVLQAMK